ncbi:MAG: monovalent cation/H(+) antiporter subunit G [Bryobacteraceae bacterium]|nr:monovalent cation/H(+) antiporter subunit G [Bryobacteraceae bacterium]
MTEILVTLALLIGTIFVFLASVGILRMPDLLTRMQATSKAVTLGLGCLMLAEAMHFGEAGTTVRFITVILFFSLTAPVAAHVIARAAYFMDVRLWRGSVVDELHGSETDRRPDV